MFNRETHKSRGFGFIIFDSEQAVDNVCAEAQHVIDGKVVEVKRAIPRSRIPSGSVPAAVSTGTTSAGRNVSSAGSNKAASGSTSNISRCGTGLA